MESQQNNDIKINPLLDDIINGNYNDYSSDEDIEEKKEIIINQLLLDDINNNSDSSSEQDEDEEEKEVVRIPPPTIIRKPYKTEEEIDDIFNLLNKLNGIKYRKGVDIKNIQNYFIDLCKLMDIPKHHIPLLNNKFRYDYKDGEWMKPKGCDGPDATLYLYIKFYKYITPDKTISNKIKKDFLILVGKIRNYGYKQIEGNFQHDNTLINNY